MDIELISKKELLELTGISYGSLYRWKRKNLIPDDWFIKKSTFTGQETFFEKEKILERIEKITQMKDDVALDDMASLFSPYGTDDIVPMEKIRQIISAAMMSVIEKIATESAIDFLKMLQIYVADSILKSGDITIHEAEMAVETMFASKDRLGEKTGRLMIYRKMGISMCFIVLNDLIPDKELKLIADIAINDKASELKMALS